jgi:hypothetical protein
MMHNLYTKTFHNNQFENLLSFYFALIAFFIHPYYILLILTLLQLIIKIKFYYFIPVYILILSLYWSTRIVGISWEGGFDDAPAYIEQFLNTSKLDIYSIITNFFKESFFSNGEIFFTLLLYLISLITINPTFFLFIIYLIILSLLSYTTYLISKRYYLLILSLVFFGIGAFLEQGALSLLRSTLGSVVFFLGVFLYQKNKKSSFFILFLSCFIHLALIPIFLFILFIIKTKFISSYFKLFFFTIIIVFILQITSKNLLESFGRLNYLYENQSIILFETIKYLVILFIYFIYFKFENLSTEEKISLFLISLILNLYIFFPNFIFMTGRYAYIIQLFIAFLTFKIFTRVKNKNLISVLIILFFIRKIFILKNSEFILAAFPNFICPFSPFLQIIKH